MVSPRPSNDFTPWTRLRQLRLNAGLPYRHNLAELVNCTGRYIGDLEGGRRRPSGDMLIKLANVFDMLPYDLEKTIPTVPPRGSTVRRTETAEVA